MTRLTTRPVLAVAGVLAASLTVAPAFAATSSTPTSLTISAAHSTVRHGAPDTFTGYLKAGKSPVAGQTVLLEKRAAGTSRWTLVKKLTSDAKGKVTDSVVVGTKKGQKEQFELVYKGTPKSSSPAPSTTRPYAGSHSRVITITVS